MQEYWKSLTKEQRESLSKKAGTTMGYLRLVFSGHKKPSFRLAKNLEIASDGYLKKEALRPDIFCS